MLYFKNSELAYTYHVSVRTVRNWIEAAKQGKLDLDLHSQGNKTYVSNTSRNLSTIEQLVERGKKYRPHRAVKTVTPKPEFYQLFNDAQIYDIIRSINLYKEIPTQYSYFDGGAHEWDRYAQRLATEDTPNNLTSTAKLINFNLEYIKDILYKYKTINIIDIGVGNALPVKDLIAEFVKDNKMGRYIALDISENMLGIAKRNLRKWFDNSVSFEGYPIDISKEGFSNIIANEYIEDDTEQACNLVLFLGGTIQSFRDPSTVLMRVHDSVADNAVFIIEQKLDTENSRRYFDFSTEAEKNDRLPGQDRFLTEILGIEEAFYDVETGYDGQKNERFIKIRLNIALSIEFNFSDKKRSLNFDKGESLLLWRAHQNSASEVLGRLDQNRFSVLQSSQTSDQEYILTISRIKRS